MSLRQALLAAFALLCAAALSWPLYPTALSGRPLLTGGIPTALWWVIGWVVASFVALAAYELSGTGEEKG